MQVGGQKRREKRKEAEIIFEGIVAENFPKLVIASHRFKGSIT